MQSKSKLSFASGVNGDWKIIFPVLNGATGVLIGWIIASFLGWV